MLVALLVTLGACVELNVDSQLFLERLGLEETADPRRGCDEELTAGGKACDVRAATNHCCALPDGSLTALLLPTAGSPTLVGEATVEDFALVQALSYFEVESAPKLTLVLKDFGDLLLEHLEYFRITELNRVELSDKSFGQKPKLSRLTIKFCNVEGPVPTSIVSLPSLQALDLSKNQFSGTVPPFKGQSLSSIFLDNNRLVGPVPKEFTYTGTTNNCVFASDEFDTNSFTCESVLSVAADQPKCTSTVESICSMGGACTSVDFACVITTAPTVSPTPPPTPSPTMVPSPSPTSSTTGSTTSSASAGGSTSSPPPSPPPMSSSSSSSTSPPGTEADQSSSTSGSDGSPGSASSDLTGDGEPESIFGLPFLIALAVIVLLLVALLLLLRRRRAASAGSPATQLSRVAFGEGVASTSTSGRSRRSSTSRKKGTPGAATPANAADGRTYGSSEAALTGTSGGDYASLSLAPSASASVGVYSPVVAGAEQASSDSVWTADNYSSIPLSATADGDHYKPIGG